MTAPRPSTKDELRREIGALIGEGTPEIAGSDNLLDLGMDSMRVMTLATRWSGTGIPLGFVDLIENPTLDAWWELLSSRSEEPA